MNDTPAPIENVLPRKKPRQRGRLLRRILPSLVLLISGGVIGSGITTILIARGIHYRLHHPEVFPARATQRLTRYLDLSDEQSKQVEGILRERQKNIAAIRRECQPRFEHEVDQIRDEISAVLTPAQARKWEEWLAERRRTWLPPVPVAEKTDAETRGHGDAGTDGAAK